MLRKTHAELARKSRPFFSSFFAIRGALLIPLIVWLFIIVPAVFHFFPKIWTGSLSDPDNYLYLTQAIDLLNGQYWFDAVQHRINPPDGTYIHYSRLLTGFYAAFIFMLRPFLGTTSAALTTAALLPPVYFAAFLFCMYRLAQRLIDKKWGSLTACVILFFPCLTYRFLPGHIDHHGLALLFSVVVFGCMVRMILSPFTYIWAIAAGGALALGLALALESVALVLFFCLCLGAWAVVEGRAAARSARIFGLTLFICSLSLLFLARAPQHFFDVDVLAYSIAYVVLTANIALCFAGVALAGEKAVLWRFVLGGCLACATGIFFFCFFPELRAGPYGGMDSALAKLIFSTAPEAWPLFHQDASHIQQIALLIGPLLALGAAMFMFVDATGRAERWIWGMIFVVLFGSLGLMIFYQGRFVIYADAFAVLPITAMIWRDWTHSLPPDRVKRAHHIVRLVLFIFVFPITTIIIRNLDINPFGEFHKPTDAKMPFSKGCNAEGLVKILNDEKGYGRRPRVIINTINEGTLLLFRTPHMVLAGPYHTNVEGNLDAQRFFVTSNPDEARAIASRRRAELVVVCGSPTQLWAYEPGMREKENAKKPFVRQLIDRQIPPWLKPIQSPLLGGFQLFEIQKMPPGIP